MFEMFIILQMSFHELRRFARYQYYFLLLLLIITCVPYIRPVHSQITGPLLLYSTKTDIRVTNLAKNKSNHTLIRDIRDGSAFDYHYNQSKLCWVDRVIESIQCASFNETGITGKMDIIAHQDVSLDGLACDWLTNKLYWTDIELNRIEVASMVDYHRKVLFWKDLDQPRAIALDPLRGLIFWTDWGDVAKIERAGMNGDPQTREVIVSNDIFWPNGLTLDYDNQHIYWLDGKLLFLKRIDYNGGNEVLLIEKISHYPYALTYFNNRLFWTDWKDWWICVFDLRNNTRNKLGNSKIFLHSGMVPMDIHILDATRQPYKAHPCETNNGGCSHLCLLAPTPPYYNCACPSGIKLNDNFNCADRPQELLIFARRTEIGVVYLDSPDYTYKVLNYTSMKHSVAVDYDPVEGYVYWTDTNISKIQRAKLDGSEQTDVLAYEVESSDGVAIDWVARNIYWTDSALDRIEVATLTGKYRKVLIYDGLVNPRGIAVAPYHGWLFWSDWNDKNPKIERSNLDGSDRMVIVSENLGWANGIALDLDRQRIYWCDAKHDKIEHARMDGSDRMVLIGDIPHAFGLSILGNYLYWTDWQRRTISRINKETGGDRELILEQISNIMGLKAIKGTPYVPDLKQHPCTVNECDQICIFVNNRNRTCVCQFGYELQPDGKSCRVPEAYLLYTKKDGLTRVSIEQVNRTSAGDLFLPIGGIKNASSMDLDVNDMRVYWSDLKQRMIMRAYINGSDPQKVVELGLQSPQGLAVDWVALNVYWADPALHRIEVSRLDGSSRRVLLWQKANVEPHFIVLDPQEGYMYWTEVAPSDLPNNSIKKAAMDGSNPQSLVVLTGFPSGLTLDYDKRRLYWIIAKPTPGIFSSDLNGLNKMTLVTGELYKPIGLTVYHDNIYWTDALSDNKITSGPVAQIVRANKMTGGNRMTTQLLSDSPTDLLIVSNAKRKFVSNQCAVNNGDCSHLCLALPHSNPSYTCACPTHYMLKNNTCVPPKRFMVYSHKNLAVRLLPDTSECLEAVLPIQGMKIVRAIDFDPNLQFLYWIEGKSRSIKRAKTIGTHVSVVIMGSSQIDPSDIVIDALGRLLFWSCSNQNVINVTRVDNSSTGGVIAQDPDERPRLLAIHPAKRLLFYTDVSDPPKLVRRNMDGSDKKVIVSKAQNVLALAIDVENDLVVWAQGSVIYKCNIDGTNRKLMLNETGSNINQLTVHNGWLYWLDGDTLKRIEMIGNSNSSAVVLDLDSEVSDLISVYEPDKAHACAHMRCSHICILNEEQEAVCACPLNMTLLEDNTCMTKPNCGSEHFTCIVQKPGKKDCIPISWKCDGQRDCPDGSDESGCPTCKPNEFKCQNGDCIDSKHYCDYEPHCKDKSDEAYCCKSPHEFQCRGTQVCISTIFLCDGIDNCANGEDEMKSVCSAITHYQPGSSSMSMSSILLWMFISLLFIIFWLAAYYYIKRAICTNIPAVNVVDHSQTPLNPDQNQAQIKLQNRNKTLGIPDVVHMSMLSASQACSYDRGHITGASSSTNGSSLVGYPRETLNPPPSPATTAASTRANSPTSRYRPYKHYRSINQPPPPTPCSTDVNDESDYNYSNRSRYDDRRYDLGSFPPPPTPRSHCNSESCPPSPSSRSSTYFSPLPPPPSPVASPGRNYDS